MTMEMGIFLFGVCVFIMLGGGLVFTILEFRKTEKRLERYRDRGWSETDKYPKRVA